MKPNQGKQLNYILSSKKCLRIFKKTLCPISMDKIQLPQGCRVTKVRQFTFNHKCILSINDALLLDKNSTKKFWTLKKTFMAPFYR